MPSIEAPLSKEVHSKTEEFGAYFNSNRYEDAEDEELDDVIATLISEAQDELSLLRECGLIVPHTEIESTYDEAEQLDIVKVETDHIDGRPLLDVLDDQDTPAELRESLKRQLVTAVDGLCKYFTARRSQDGLFLYDVFSPQQFMVDSDGTLIMVDTDPYSVDSDHIQRHGHEMAALTGLQSLALHAMDKEAMATFLEWRDETVRAIAKDAGRSPSQAFAVLGATPEDISRADTRVQQQELITTYSSRANRFGSNA